MNEFAFDWAELAFASKKAVRDLNATFIAAPRTMSSRRFKDLVKTYLPKGDIILGLAKEPYIEGLEDRPQFTTLSSQDVADVTSRVNQNSPHRIYTLSYFQRETPLLCEKLKFPRVVLVNGSWLRSFHLRPEYYALMQQGTPFVMVSPFVDEDEAKTYEQQLAPQLAYQVPDTLMNEAEVFDEVERAAMASYDTSFPVGAILVRKEGRKYRPKLAAHNTVVPYETYALHHGASRERHLTSPGDLNYYDSVHAEMLLLVEATKQSLSLAGLSLFINVLPCPTCARALAKTDIAEIVYSLDHSDGYAVALLEASGKTIRRRVGKEVML